MDSLVSYKNGDIPKKWNTLVHSKKLEDFEGEWELIIERSDSCDEIMSALGISPLKRSLLKNFKTVVSINVTPPSDTNMVQNIQFCTHFPIGLKKIGVFSCDGKFTYHKDNDTNVEWKSNLIFHEGKLLQKRESSKGTMYDTRCLFLTDPENKSSESPIKLFKWTLYTPDGAQFETNRWFRKLK